MFAGGLAGGMAQQGLNAIGMGGMGGGGGGGGGGMTGLGGSGTSAAPQQMSMPQFQNPAYQMLGSGPNMQAMNAVPTSVSASNPTMIAGSQQKYLTTAPSGGSTMPVFAGYQQGGGGGGGGGGYYDQGFSYGYNGGLGGGSRKSLGVGGAIGAYGDFLGNMFGTSSRSLGGSLFGGSN